MSTVKTALQIFDRLEIAYPDAGPMLRFDSVFECLIAVVLSAQSTDEQVNRVTERLFKKYHTPHDFAALDLEDLQNEIKAVGLYRNKARSIQALSMILIKDYDGLVPESFEELLALPGVGRKTANVVRSVGFHRPGLGVDTHVQRVANRLGLVCEKNPDKTELRLKTIFPEESWSRAHHLFIFHGRRTCHARKPNCSHCAVEDLCQKVLDD